MIKESVSNVLQYSGEIYLLSDYDEIERAERKAFNQCRKIGDSKDDQLEAIARSLFGGNRY